MQKARDAIWRFFWIGLVLEIVGGIIIGTEYPHDTVTPGVFGSRDLVTHHGSAGGALFGYLVGGIGTTLVLLALVAWAVRLGVESAHVDRSAAGLTL